MYLNLQFEQGDILFREDQRFYIHGDIMKVNLDKLLWSMIWLYRRYCFWSRKMFSLNTVVGGLQYGKFILLILQNDK